MVSAVAAQQGGAAWMELCDHLAEGAPHPVMPHFYRVLKSFDRSYLGRVDIFNLLKNHIPNFTEACNAKTTGNKYWFFSVYSTLSTKMGSPMAASLEDFELIYAFYGDFLGDIE